MFLIVHTIDKTFQCEQFLIQTQLDKTHVYT